MLLLNFATEGVSCTFGHPNENTFEEFMYLTMAIKFIVDLFVRVVFDYRIYQLLKSILAHFK